MMIETSTKGMFIARGDSTTALKVTSITVDQLESGIQVRVTYTSTPSPQENEVPHYGFRKGDLVWCGGISKKFGRVAGVSHDGTVVYVHLWSSRKNRWGSGLITYNANLVRLVPQAELDAHLRSLRKETV